MFKNLKKITIAIIVFLGILIPNVAFSARTDSTWDCPNGANYCKPNVSTAGSDILIFGSSKYLNFGAVSGLNGYGFRDNAGTIEFKNSGGSWTAVGTGGGGGGGTDGNWTFFNGSGIRLATTTNQVLVGATATTSLASLEVIGNGYISGNVGIGTTTPFSTLGISSNGINTGISIGALGSAAHQIYNDVGLLRLRSTGSTGFNINNTEVMRISSNLNVGIGTTSPYSTLSVVGQIVASNYIGTTTTASSLGGNLTIGQLLLINTPSGNPEFDFQVGGTTRGKTFFDETNHRLTFQNNQNNNADALFFADPATFTGTVIAQDLISAPAASTTLLSVFNKAYFGSTATTTIDSIGNLILPSGAGLTNTGRTDGCATWATGLLTSTGVACGAGSGGVNAGTIGQNAYYAANGTTISATSTIFTDVTTNVGIGSTSPQAKLSVHLANGEIKPVVFDVASSTSVGTTSLFSVLSNRQINIGGNKAIIGLPATFNWFFGDCGNLTVSGSFNTCLGRNSLLVVTGGASNMAIGLGALGNTTSGSRNIAVGVNAMGFTQTGSDDVAIGDSAGLGVTLNSNSKNTFLGAQAGRNITTGSNNIFIGYQAASTTSTGARNISIGFTTKLPNITGSNQLNIGNLIYGTSIDGEYDTPSTGNIGIGTSSPYARLSIQTTNGGQTPLFVIASSTNNLATSTAFLVTATGGVAIGTSTPSLTSSFVVGTTTYTALSINGVSGKVGIGCENNGSTKWTFGCGTNINVNPNINLLVQDPADARLGTAVNNQGVFIKAIGQGIYAYNYTAGAPLPLILQEFGNNVGIGTTSPWRILSVTGTVAIDGLSSATSKNAVCIDSVTKELVNAGNTTCLTSSIKTKHDITNITGSEALDELLKLKPVSFTYNDGGDRRIGFVAEDVNKVDTRLVEYAQEDTTFPKASGVIKKGDPISVEYANMTALLVKVAQDQQVKIESLAGGAKKSVQDNWQWAIIALLATGFVYQQFQIQKLKK